MPAKMPRSSEISIIQLWNPEVNTITSDIKQRVVTQSIQKIENNRVRRGPGAIASSEFNFNEFRAYTIRVYNPTPGFYDDVLDDGKPWYAKNSFDGVDINDTAYTGANIKTVGTTRFQLRDSFDNPFVPAKVNNIFITLDGILQEPGVAYTIDGSDIVFAQAPLGDRKTDWI